MDVSVSALDIDSWRSNRRECLIWTSVDYYGNDNATGSAGNIRRNDAKCG